MLEPIEVQPGTMTRVLSPKQLARVIGASESSLKRWIDGGQLNATRTTGGHRRVPLAEAVRFIREHQHPIVDPQPLGLPASTAESPESLADHLYQTLTNGDAIGTRTILMTAYVSGTPIAELCDGPLRQALIRIGALSDHGQLDADIAIEHLATDTCLNALNYLRSYLPETTELAPIALGGAPSGDPYLIPSLMAAMTFETCGFRTRNLGPNTPLAALHEAAVRYRPRIVWISLCSPDGLGVLHQPLLHLADELAQNRAVLMVGGRVSPQLTLEPRSNILRCTSLQQAADHARRLLHT